MKVWYYPPQDILRLFNTEASDISIGINRACVSITRTSDLILFGWVYIGEFE